MQWHELFPKDKMPTAKDISDFITGDQADLWTELTEVCQQRWKARSKLTFSTCSGKPGWNLKLQKSGKTLATLYPEKESFSALLVIPNGAAEIMLNVLPELSKEIAEMYLNAGDYMKVGKWMMFRIADRHIMHNCLRIIAVKMEA